MAWGSVTSCTQLTLTENYQDVTGSTTTLNPGEIAQVMLTFTPTDTSPTEDCDVIVNRTADGTTYETDGEALRYKIEVANRNADDPAIRSITIAGVYGFKIRARVRDTDDTPGTDNTDSTLDVDIRKDGVSI